MKSFLNTLLLFIFNISIYSQVNIQWENTIGGNDIEWNDFIERTSDGNCIIGGYSYSNISGDKTENSRGAGDYWIVKLDVKTGNILWQKTIGGNNFDHLTSGMETQDKGFVLGGYSSSDISGDKNENSRGADDYWVVKLDSNRNIVWQKTYGGNIDDRLSTIIPTDDGGYIMGGYSESGISGDKTQSSYGLQDAWVIKTDAIGNITWQKTYGGNQYDNIESIIKTSDNSYILICSSLSGISGNKTEKNKGYGGDYWVIKIDLKGNIIWQKTIGGNNGDYAKSGVEAGDGNYIISGDSSSGISGNKTQANIDNSTDAWLVKLNKNNGNIIWQKVIGGNSTDWQPSIKKTSDNGFILQVMSYSGISGQKSEANKGSRDYWFVKLNSIGDVEWDKTIGGDDLDEPQAIIEITPNEYICSGWSQSNASGDKSENKSGLQDNWVVKLKYCPTNNNNITALSNSPVCTHQNIELKASGGTNYYWTGPNSFTSTDQNPVITNATTTHSGQYSCTISGTSGCDTTLKIDVVVGDSTAPVPDIANLPTITSDCNTKITTTPTATDNCSGAIYATTTDPLTYTTLGNYTIHWSYNDGNGNSATQNQNVVITTALPIISSTQSFCTQQNAKISNITITGQNIKWYDAQTGGNLLATNTLLQNETIYYASQTINNCESDRVSVTISIYNTPAPTANANQSFCSTANATLNEIAITGTDVKWYGSTMTNTPLSITTPLVNNSTYYATQTLNGCESVTRTAVKINLINTLNAVDFLAYFCDDLNNGNEKVDLTTYNTSLISNTNGNTFSYYKSKLEAQNQTSSEKINNEKDYQLNVGTSKIFVRIDNINTCSQIVELNLTLYSKPIIPINEITPICQGSSSITISAGTFDKYQWSTGENTPSIRVTQSGNYSVTVTQNHIGINCSSIKDFKVVNSNNATINNIVISDWSNNNNAISIIVTNESVGDYEYSIDGIIYQDSNTFNNLSTGEYTIYVRDKNGCGTAKDLVYIISYPKFFTPNNDGHNDFWKINFAKNEPNLIIQIYDRYGKLLKTLNNDSKGWDGTFQGQPLPADDYWFTVVRPNGKEYKEHFTLKR